MTTFNPPEKRTVPLTLPELPPGTTPFDAPLAYLAAGLRPIALAGVSEQSACTCPKGAACGKPGKHPRSKDWQRGMTAPELRAAFERDPRGNVGLVMGGEARLAALDIDGTLGREQLAAFERQHGPLPQTATARTGSDDSEHRVFRVPPHLDLAALSNRVGVAGRSAAGGLDVRAEGGQIVVEPSLHRSGRRYQWTHRGPIADMPEALFRWLTEPTVEAASETPEEVSQGGSLPFDGPTPDPSPGPAPSSPHPKASSASASGASSASSAPHDPRANRPEAFERARRYLAEMPPAIQGQGGSKRLFRAAVVLVRGFNLSDADALELLWQDFNPRCQPPWNRKDKDGPEHKVRDARRKGDMPFGALLEKEGDWRTPPDEQARARRAAGPDAPSSRPASEEHHQEHDHHDQEPAMPAPEPAPFVPFQTPRDLPGFPVEALPPVVATFVEQLAGSLEVPVDLPGCLALATLASVGMRLARVRPKPDWTEPLNLFVVVVMGPAENKSAAFRQVLAPLFEHQRDLISEWEKACKRIDDANDGTKKGERAPRPPRPRWIVDDVTPERLGVLLAEHNERMTVASEEGTLFDIATGIYAKDGRANVGVLLKGHDGGTYVVDRMMREPVFLERPLLTCTLAVQPTVIQALAKRPDLRGRGLWARFAYAFPASLVGRRTFRTPSVDPEARDAYRYFMLGLARRQPPETEMILRFTTEARERIEDVAQMIERAMDAGGPLASLRDWGGKLRGLIVRLAGLLHLVEQPDEQLVDVATLERAITLGRYFLAHARYAFDVEMSLDPAEQMARVAWEVIERRGLDRITPSLAGRLVKALRKTNDATAALEVLVRQGCLAPDPEHHGKGRV